MLYVLSGFVDSENSDNSCLVDAWSSQVCLLCIMEYVHSGFVGYGCRWNRLFVENWNSEFCLLAVVDYVHTIPFSVEDYVLSGLVDNGRR